MRGRNLLVALLCLGAAPVFAQSGSDSFAGRRLEDALRLLQHRGVRILFSSELVKPEMRVTREPRGTTPSQQLREMLEAHGLTIKDENAAVLVVVRVKKRDDPPHSVSPLDRETPAPREVRTSTEPAYHEQLTVTASGHSAHEISGGPERRLDSSQLAALAGRIADDPIRLVQTLSGVAASDDFRNEYSVRGSSYRHAAVVLDGVAASWLQHGAMGRAETGTLTMLSGDAVQDASLLIGAYPRKNGGQLGPELQLTLREGSRAARAFHASVSGMSAVFRAEGPLGTSGRGSWIVGIRRSHVEWPVGRDDEDGGSVFGFTDVQSKLVYDVSSGQQVSLTAVAGVSNIDRDVPDALGATGGLNRAALMSAAWRSLIAPRTVVFQRAAFISHDFLDKDRGRRTLRRGDNAAASYRVDLTHAVLGGVLESGGQIQRLQGTRHGPVSSLGWAKAPEAAGAEEDIEASWREQSGYASFQRTVRPGVLFEAGIRGAGSTLVDRGALDRWVRGEWAATPEWMLHASAGTVHQLAAVEQLLGWTSRPDLRPERATSLDLGITRHLPGSISIDATLFTRRELDVLREPVGFRPSTDRLSTGARLAERFENALSGTARGVELTFQRRSASRLSGWVAYSYGVARQTDITRAETFDADRDQRHAINATGTIQLPGSTTVGATFRSGTNFPVPGYVAMRDGQLVASDRRNQIRLPAYARLDLRAERVFHYSGRRFVLFADVLNVLNRTNVAIAGGRLLQEPSDATAVSERLFPRLMTAGIRFQF